MSDIITKAQLLQNFAQAYERVIETATQVEQRGQARRNDPWGPRQVIAHMAGWETMATVRIPRIIAGTPPAEFPDSTQEAMMNDALNTAFVTLTDGQSLSKLSDILRRAYQQVIELLKPLDDSHFQPGQYIYERTVSAIEHCQEHIDQLVPAQAG